MSPLHFYTRISVERDRYERVKSIWQNLRRKPFSFQQEKRNAHAQLCEQKVCCWIICMQNWMHTVHLFPDRVVSIACHLVHPFTMLILFLVRLFSVQKWNTATIWHPNLWLTAQFELPDACIHTHIHTIEIERISFSIHWLYWRMFSFRLVCVCVFSLCIWYRFWPYVRVNGHAFSWQRFFTQNWVPRKKSFTLGSNCATTVVVAAAADISLPLSIWSHTNSIVVVVVAAATATHSSPLPPHHIRILLFLFTLFVIL